MVTYELKVVASGEGYTLEELCQRRTLENEFVIQCVEYGITEVQGGEPAEEWVFPVECIARLEKAYRLQRDLNLDFSALAIVLDLLDDIEQLNSRVDRLTKRLAEWEAQ